MAEAKHRQKRLADQSRQECEFKVGDMVLVSTENMRTPTGLKPKLAPRRIGPFPITKVKRSGVAVQLDLSSAPKLQRLCPTFHVSLLERYVPPDDPSLSPDVRQPAHQTTQPADTDLQLVEEVMVADDTGTFDVERIVRHEPRLTRDPTAVTRYFIRWKGYDSIHDTWEPAAYINTHLPEFVEEYWDWRRRQDQLDAQAMQAQTPVPPAAPQPPTRHPRTQRTYNYETNTWV